MNQLLIYSFCGIIVLGISAQWLAWYLKIPAILLLLSFGFVAGPISGYLDPDLIFGDLLFPIVSLSIGIILFEGGLSLRLKDTREMRVAIRNLITIAPIINGLLIASAAYILLDFSLSLSLLIGSILLVTGPTTIKPLLHHLFVKRRLKVILKWEGIMVDPIGVLLALLVFESFFLIHLKEHVSNIVATIILTVLMGSLCGLLGGLLIAFLMKKNWIPDYLQEGVMLMMVLIVYVLSNLFQHESGLVAVTLMGIILANQKMVRISHIHLFKSNLTLLLISGLFIILSARIPLAQLLSVINLKSILFLIFIIFVSRPIAVFISLMGSRFQLRERLFISLIGPRGIVSAMMAAFFAIRLNAGGYNQLEALVPTTFFIIFGTICFNSLTASSIAKILKLDQTHRQGVLIVGADAFACQIAFCLKSLGLPVLLMDEDKKNILSARSQGLPTIQGNPLSEKCLEEAEQGKYKQLLALSPNDELNALVNLEYGKILGRLKVYRLSPSDITTINFTNSSDSSQFLFGKGITTVYINTKMTIGAAIKLKTFSDKTYYQAYLASKEGNAIPLFILSSQKILKVISTESKIDPKPGDSLVVLV